MDEAPALLGEPVVERSAEGDEPLRLFRLLPPPDCVDFDARGETFAGPNSSPLREGAPVFGEDEGDCRRAALLYLSRGGDEGPSAADAFGETRFRERSRGGVFVPVMVPRLAVFPASCAEASDGALLDSDDDDDDSDDDDDDAAEDEEEADGAEDFVIF